MICFEVRINGIQKYIVGSDEAEEFTACVYAAPKLKPPHVAIDISGFIANVKEHPHELRWDDINLKVGDEINVKIIESDIPDKPKKTLYEHGVDNSDEQAHSMLCSCCGKSQSETNRILRSSNVTLCEECVVSFTEILKDKKD